MNRQQIIGQRIRAAREALGWSQEYLGALYGCSGSAISRIESGQISLSVVDLEKFSRLLEQPLDYFVNPEDVAPISRPFDAVLKELEVVRPVAIPIFDQETSASEGIPIHEYAYWAPPRVAGRNIKAIKVRGKCLLPAIEDGDIVFFDTDASPHDRQLVVALVDNTLCIKRFRHQGSEKWLESNKERIAFDDAQIQGVVVSFQRWLG